jgi:hypothetical protein
MCRRNLCTAPASPCLPLPRNPMRSAASLEAPACDGAQKAPRWAVYAPCALNFRSHSWTGTRSLSGMVNFSRDQRRAGALTRAAFFGIRAMWQTGSDNQQQSAIGRFRYGANVRANGIRLHYLRYGGSGTPLIVLPGITSPAATWDFVARRLPRRTTSTCSISAAAAFRRVARSSTIRSTPMLRMWSPSRPRCASIASCCSVIG